MLAELLILLGFKSIRKDVDDCIDAVSELLVEELGLDDEDDEYYDEE